MVIAGCTERSGASFLLLDFYSRPILRAIVHFVRVLSVVSPAAVTTARYKDTRLLLTTPAALIQVAGA